MATRGQIERLTKQHKLSEGVLGIFNSVSKEHDINVGTVAKATMQYLTEKYPYLKFRHRNSISKKEINDSLKELDDELGQTLFVDNSSIRPDGGIIEVEDDNKNWRIVLVTEAKHQGNDVENIRSGNLVGKDNNQDLMVAGNAIERSHKNIDEIANYMLSEIYFPYVIFLEGSNFITETIEITRPDGRKVKLEYKSGSINRLDRLTAANYGMPFNKNLCENKFVSIDDRLIMLQAASMYTAGNGEVWEAGDMLNIMIDISETSIQCLARDIFKQLAGKNDVEDEKE